MSTPPVHVTLYLEHRVATAVDLSGLRGRAMVAGIAEYSCEVGRGKHSRRFTWHVHCRRAVAEMLIREIEAVRGKSDDDGLRRECDRTVATVRAELDGAAPQPNLRGTDFAYLGDGH